MAERKTPEEIAEEVYDRTGSHLAAACANNSAALAYKEADKETATWKAVAESVRATGPTTTTRVLHCDKCESVQRCSELLQARIAEQHAQLAQAWLCHDAAAEIAEPMAAEIESLKGAVRERDELLRELAQLFVTPGTATWLVNLAAKARAITRFKRREKRS